MKPNYQTGPKEKAHEDESQHPLRERKSAFESEVMTPTVPTIEHRAPQFDYQTATPRGKVSEGPMETGLANPETWDSYEADPDTNFHERFVKMGIEHEDESVAVDSVAHDK